MTNVANDDGRLEAGPQDDRLLSQAEEAAPGVLEETRFFLKATIATVAALFLERAGSALVSSNVIEPSRPGRHTGGNQPPAACREPGSPNESTQLDFDRFFQECATLAKEALADPNLNEDAHLYRIAAVAARLNPKSIPQTKTGRFAGLNPPVSFGPVRVAVPLGVILWRLDPGAVLPAHNHTPADVLSICLAGEARVRHFDIVSDAPEYSSKRPFLIRETLNVLLTPGRTSGLTQIRDNIHTFHAGDKGAVGIDINTFLPGNKDFSFLEFKDKPVDADKRTYEAVWTKLGS